MSQTERPPKPTIDELAITTMSNGDTVLYDPDADPKPWLSTDHPDAPLDLEEHT